MKDFAAIDFETANGQRTSVCSVGVVIVRGGETVDKFYALIHPQPNYYCRHNTLVHGLTQEDTDTALPFPEVWAQIAPRLQGLTLVAHKKDFDEGCLKAVFQAYGMEYPGYEFLCTLQASRRCHPTLPDHQLDTAAAACGYDMTNHHHALADAEACAEIAKQLL